MLSLLFAQHCFSKSNRILAILGNKDDQDKFGLFFEDLKKISSSLDFEVCGHDSIALERFGEKLYDTVVITCAKSSCFPRDAEDLKTFIDTGGNAIVFNNDQGSDIQDKLFRHLNIRVLSTNKFSDIFDNSEVVLRNFVAPTAILSKKPSPIVFEGGYATIERPNEFRIPIVTGGIEHVTSSGDRMVSSSSVAYDMVPIYCLQARTGGRILFVHSSNFASNEFYEKKVQYDENMKKLTKPSENGNRQLMNELCQWVSSYKSAIRIVHATHYDSKTHQAPVQYHIKQNITVVASLESSVNGEYVPYTGNDVQVEIFMLGTFVRRHMKLVSPGKYEETFAIPDRAGNYKVKVFTSLEGWLNGREEMAIAVRPLAIREKEKFLPCSQPYSQSMLVIMIGAFLAVFHFLYHKPSD